MATTYPYTQQAMLVNSVQSTSVISIMSGMQVATVTFTTAAGMLGEITLSPVQPVATNVEFTRGKQVLQIANITFRAQFGFDPGQVTCNGSATDQNGKDSTAFNAQICYWS